MPRIYRAVIHLCSRHVEGPRAYRRSLGTRRVARLVVVSIAVCAGCGEGREKFRAPQDPQPLPAPTRDSETGFEFPMGSEGSDTATTRGTE